MIPITGAGLSSRFVAFLFTDHSRHAGTDHRPLLRGERRLLVTSDNATYVRSAELIVAVPLVVCSHCTWQIWQYRAPVIQSITYRPQRNAHEHRRYATRDNEVTILARVFDDERGLLPPELARSILDVEFSERDKARMHDLAVRNQADALSPAEKEELYALRQGGHAAGHPQIEGPADAEDQAEERRTYS